MTNLQKRVLTSFIIFPLSFFFIIKGNFFLIFFLLAIFFLVNYELITVFKKKKTILFLDLLLILSLFSIFYLTENPTSLYFLLWLVILVACSDIGGYIFGKIFKWGKLTKISPKKTFSGALGSLIFSVISIFISNLVLPKILIYTQAEFYKINLLEPKFFFLAVLLSLISQVGDVIISYFKRLEKIKDAGKILPGHGGILDRVDGLMFVVILGFILVRFNFI
jgi:phosphatidate cytidylyltransferase